MKWSEMWGMFSSEFKQIPDSQLTEMKIYHSWKKNSNFIHSSLFLIFHFILLLDIKLPNCLSHEIWQLKKDEKYSILIFSLHSSACYTKSRVGFCFRLKISLKTTPNISSWGGWKFSNLIISHSWKFFSQFKWGVWVKRRMKKIEFSKEVSSRHKRYLKVSELMLMCLSKSYVVTPHTKCSFFLSILSFLSVVVKYIFTSRSWSPQSHSMSSMPLCMKEQQKNHYHSHEIIDKQIA